MVGPYSVTGGREYRGHDTYNIVGPHGCMSWLSQLEVAVLWCDRLNTAHAAGAASRDAEVARLREALERGAQVNTPDFLDWLADRLVNVYGENPNVDFVLSARARAAAIREALNQEPPHAAE